MTVSWGKILVVVFWRAIGATWNFQGADYVSFKEGKHVTPTVEIFFTKISPERFQQKTEVPQRGRKSGRGRMGFSWILGDVDKGSFFFSGLYIDGRKTLTFFSGN